MAMSKTSPARPDMQQSTAFAPGWLREQITESIREFIADPRVSEEQKEAFRLAGAAVEQSNQLRRREEKAKGDEL